MKRVFVFFLILMFIPVIGFCSTTKVLSQDTDLHPQGWPNGTLKFKSGTQVTLNENGEVITGYMKFKEDLITPGSVTSFYDEETNGKDIYRVTFLGYPHAITFNEKGEAVYGTVWGSFVSQIVKNAGSYINFIDNTVISFDSDGSIKQGTIYNAYEFRPAGWHNFLPTDDKAGFIKFKEGTEVIFGSSAQVTKGTIANDLTVNGITYPAGTTLQFSESGLPQKI